MWHLDSLALLARMEGHSGAVLALELVQERERPWLISSSGDGTVRVSTGAFTVCHAVCLANQLSIVAQVWHTPSLTALYSIQPPHDNVGDIFSLAWVPWDLLDEDDNPDACQQSPMTRSHIRKHKPGRLYAGCQDTSIMVSAG